MKNQSKQLAPLLLVLVFIFTCNPVFADTLAEFEGLIEPFELVNIGSPVEGVVADVKVQRSSSVKKGEPLVVLDSSVENAVVERARVLAEVEGELKLQKERLEFAKRMQARVEELFNSDAISAEKNDAAAPDVTLARARLQKAKENRALAKLDLQRAKAMLNQRTIKSPLSGIVIERYVSPGEFVASQPLLRIAQMDPLRVEVILPAEMFKKIKPGMEAQVIPETEQEGSYSSVVTIVDRVIDPASGTFGVRLELPNPDYRLPSGLKCAVRFEDGNKNIAPGDSQTDITKDVIAQAKTKKSQVNSLAQ